MLIIWYTAEFEKPGHNRKDARLLKRAAIELGCKLTLDMLNFPLTYRRS